jgi:hypothetical protein
MLDPRMPLRAAFVAECVVLVRFTILSPSMEHRRALFLWGLPDALRADD